MSHHHQQPSPLLREEQNQITLSGGPLFALGYPASYGVGVSSLGFQTVYRLFNETTPFRCERFFCPDNNNQSAITTLESGSPIAHAVGIGFSVATETELLGVVQILSRAGLQPLAKMRDARQPAVVIGGPLTGVDPRLVAPLADVVVCGEAEEAISPLADALLLGSKEAVLSKLSQAGKGIWVPAHTPIPPPSYRVQALHLPARAATWSPNAVLKDLFLIELARGCPRGCRFCLLANSGRFRKMDIDELIHLVPLQAKGVGLVGAAVTDHPQVLPLVERLVARGQRVSLSSIRADKLSLPLLKVLVAGGLKSLTVAADGSSEEIRKNLRKGITAHHLKEAVQMARTCGLRRMKIYSMVGLPDETQADLAELAQLLVQMSKSIQLTVSVQPFVPKPNTPLVDAPFVPINEQKRRLKWLQKQIGRKINLRAPSVRGAWLDWKLCHGKQNAALAAVEAARLGGDFAAWKKGISKYL